MLTHPQHTLTIGELARRCNIQRDKAAYLVLRLGLRPVGRAGLYRLFDETAVEALRNELGNTPTRPMASAL